MRDSKLSVRIAYNMVKGYTGPKKIQNMNLKEWDFNHAACPKCGSTEVKRTTIGIPEIDGEYDDHINTAECGCGWSGMVKELVPANTGQDKPMPIKMLDFDGESYASVKDTVVAILDFNKKLNNTLPRDDMKKFADAIFGEITGMLVTVDKQHWINKYKFQAAADAEAKAKAKTGLDAKTKGASGEGKPAQ